MSPFVTLTSRDVSIRTSTKHYPRRRIVRMVTMHNTMLTALLLELGRERFSLLKKLVLPFRRYGPLLRPKPSFQQDTTGIVILVTDLQKWKRKQREGNRSREHELSYTGMNFEFWA